MTSTKPITDAGMTTTARLMVERIVEHFPADATPKETALRQGNEVAGDAGEFCSALLRYLDTARRPGSFDEMERTLASVVVSAYLAANYLAVDLDDAVTRRVQTILGRPARNPR
jgi:hypothetical protein